MRQASSLLQPLYGINSFGIFPRFPMERSGFVQRLEASKKIRVLGN